MDTYSFLRELADSWVLLALTLFFLGVWAWAWRPGSRPIHDDAAAAPFRHDDTLPTDAKAACSGDCDACACTTLANFPEVRR